MSQTFSDPQTHFMAFETETPARQAYSHDIGVCVSCAAYNQYGHTLALQLAFITRTTI
jgi:hypothetical protein